MAQEFAAQPPLAIALMRSAFAEGLDDILRRELDLQPALMISRDHREAVAAFFEKRPGKFTGE